VSGYSRVIRLIVGLILLAGFVVTSPLPTAQATPKLTVTPAKPIRGEQFTVTGTLGGKTVRAVQLQVRSGHDWKALGQPGTTDATGKYSLTGTATAKSLTVRVLAPAQPGLAKVTTATRRISTVGQSGKLAIASSAHVNQAVTVTLTFTPARAGREVRLQVRQGSRWTDLGVTGTESAKGKALIRVNAAAAGTFTYRGQAVSRHGAAAATTSSRKLTIKPDAVVVDADARPLTSAETARITSYSASTGTLILTGPPASAKTITAGDVLPIPPRVGIASGALRKVTAVSTKGGTMTVKTTDANLPDVITNVPDGAGDIALSVLTPGTFHPGEGVTVDAQPTRPRTSGRLNPAETGVTIPVGTPISLTLDMTLKSGAFSGALKGKVVLQPYMRMAFDTDWGTVASYKIGAGVVSTSSVTFEAAAKATAKATVSLGRISQIMTGTIGPVPVWVQDDLELVAELSASGSIKVSSVWRGSYEAGIKGSRGDKEPQIYTGGDPITAEIGDFAAAITLSDFIGPQVQLSIYSLVGPYVRVGVLAKGTISYDALKGFSCKLQVGPHLEAGIKTSEGLEKLTGIAYSTKFGIDFAVAEKEYCPDGTNGGGTGGGGGGGGGGGTTTLAVTTTSLPEATVGTAYNTSVAHTGGTAPYTWAATGLPDGLSINPGNGVITGTPTTAGLTSVVFTVTDSTGATASVTLTAQVNAAPSRTAVQVSAGIRFSCALNATGAVQCWGDNAGGQLGDGGPDSSSTPVQVSGLDAGVKAIASSEDATCAITATGTVECWGIGNIGELGQGQADLTNHRTPVAVPEVGNSVTAISASGNHFCAVTAGEVYCWGYNWYGEVNGIPEDQFAVSKAIGPVHIPGLSNVTAVTAGNDHNCAMSAGQVKCWGNNESAELGTGEATDTPVSTPVVASVLGATQVSQLIAGAGYTCVVTTGHTARCWGSIDAHRLGTDVDTGGLAYAATPVTVDGLSGTTSMLGVKGVNACAVTTAGAVTCWGSVATGDFLEPNYLPTVAISSGISLVGPGTHHSCAVTRVGGVTCWGLNSYYQLGTNDINANGPVDVPGFG